MSGECDLCWEHTLDCKCKNDSETTFEILNNTYWKPMICKWISNNPFLIHERRKIKEAIDLNMSYREMGEYVGRPKTSVMRESKRLGKPKDYDPDKAQEDFEKKQKLIGIKKK